MSLARDPVAIRRFNLFLGEVGVIDFHNYWYSAATTRDLGGETSKPFFS
jgi:hypothetical protein